MKAAKECQWWDFIMTSPAGAVLLQKDMASVHQYPFFPAKLGLPVCNPWKDRMCNPSLDSHQKAVALKFLAGLREQESSYIWQNGKQSAMWECSVVKGDHFVQIKKLTNIKGMYLEQMFSVKLIGVMVSDRNSSSFSKVPQIGLATKTYFVTPLRPRTSTKFNFLTCLLGS